MNKTRKARPDISMDVLQKLVKKYNVTRSGSKKEVAMRLRQGRPHMMLLSELNMIEDYLKLPPKKRYSGSRYRRQKDGKLAYVGKYVYKNNKNNKD